MEGETSKAVDRALILLDTLSRTEQPVGTRELARSTGFPISATHRILSTLESHGYVRQDSSDKFVLGAKILELGARFLERLDLRHVALTVMRQIRDRCDETVSLFIVDGTDRVCVESVDSRQSVRRVVDVGSRLPLYAGASGKLLLAFLPSDGQEAVLRSYHERFTDYTITDTLQLRRELETIRSEGFARSVGERMAGSGSVSAPVWGIEDGQVAAALTISAPLNRFDLDRERFLLTLVREGAVEISKLLGARAMGSPATAARKRETTDGDEPSPERPRESDSRQAVAGDHSEPERG